MGVTMNRKWAWSVVETLHLPHDGVKLLALLLKRLLFTDQLCTLLLQSSLGEGGGGGGGGGGEGEAENGEEEEEDDARTKVMSWVCEGALTLS